VTIRLDATFEEGFGTSIACADAGGWWVAATTSVAHIWRGHDLLHGVALSGFVRGRPSFDGDSASVRVGEYTIDVASGEIVGRLADRSWLTEALDDASAVTPTDFATPTFSYLSNGTRAVVLSKFLQPRGLDASTSFDGPLSQLLLVDVDAGVLVAELVHDAHEHRGLVDASDGAIAAAGGTTISTWVDSSGSPIASWASDALIEAITVAPGGSEIATLDRTGELTVWSTNGEKIRSFPAHDDAGAALVWDRSGRWIASASRDGCVRAWAAEGERELIGEYQTESVGGMARGPALDGLIVAGDVVDQDLTLLTVVV
jgi:hypothetical protein